MIDHQWWPCSRSARCRIGHRGSRSSSMSQHENAHSRVHISTDSCLITALHFSKKMRRQIRNVVPFCLARDLIWLEGTGVFFFFKGLRREDKRGCLYFLWVQLSFVHLIFTWETNGALIHHDFLKHLDANAYLGKAQVFNCNMSFQKKTSYGFNTFN